MPDPLPPKGYLSEGRWSVQYVLAEDEAHQVFLEFITSNPMTNSQHMRILQDGLILDLEYFWDSVSYDPQIPGDKEAAERRYREHNEVVAESLRKVGLI